VDCRQYLNVLDDLLVAAPDDAVHTAALEHVAACPSCADEHRRAGNALAALAVQVPVRATPALKARILNEAISIAADENESIALHGRPHRWSVFRLKKSTLAMAVAALVLIASAFLLWRVRGEGQLDESAFSLLKKAYAADQGVFQTGRVVHIVNEILVRPIADPALSSARWFPIVSLEATGQPRFHQLSLAAKPVEDYTVSDESWYEASSGRFVRKLAVGGTPIYANSFDGQAVYWLNSSGPGPAQVEKHAVTAEFRPPQNPEQLLGIAAGLPTRIDEKDKSLVSDAGEVSLDDGTKGRLLRVRYPQPDEFVKQNAYMLFAIRNDDNRIARIEFVVDGKSLYEVRRVTTETIDRADITWNLAGVADAVADAPKPPAGITPDMVVPNVAVKHMVEKASFPTYIFQSNPPWAGERQITDILDVVSPPNRMFAITYRAQDGRHVVLLQSASYNRMMEPITKIAKVVYTSPSGVKVLSGPQDKWLAGILLQSSQATIQDPPAENRTGYLLQTPEGTFPALAVNGTLTDEELHALVDSLVRANTVQ
jgi:hypothetical protein